MSQGDQNVANASGATVRADINAELQALVSLSSGASAPGTTYPNQLWVDTTNSVLRRRDNANSAWMIVDTMDTDRVLSKSSGYTVALRDMGKLILGDTTSAAVTLTLPAVASAGEGFRVEVKNVGTGANALTLDGNASETVNGATTVSLSDGESAIVWCDGSAWQAIVLPTADSLTLPRGYLSGLTLSNNGTDADHDVDVAAGECRDGADAFDMALAATMTKQIDAAWAAGSGAGGLFAGTVANNTWYHVFLIRKISDGSIDAGFDTSASAANIPAGYSAFRRLGAVLTDGSANVLSFTQLGGQFLLSTPINDIAAANPGTAAVLRTLSVPSGVQVEADISVVVRDSSATVDTAVLITSPDQSDTAPSATGVADLVVTGTGAGVDSYTGTRARVRTNTSSQVRSRLSATAATVTLYITTHGWRDERGTG